jgi:DMSO/TMAO reductase YedYZ molybdopterin-dependent catalytic subunit
MNKKLLIAAFLLILGVMVTGFIGFSASFFKPVAPASPSSPNDSIMLLVDGSVQHPLNLSFDELLAMPKTTIQAVLYCVDDPTTPIAEGNWTGVRLALILERAGVSKEAVKVAFYAEDGYSTDLKVTTVLREDIILAYERNGDALTEKLRLVIPGKWGYKWISEVTHIELVNYDFKGRWESMGYSDEAEIPSSP